MATGGTLAGALLPAAAAGGGGALIGGGLARALHKSHAETLQEQLDRGGLVLWVRCVTEEHAETAQRILRENGAEHVHVHRMHVPGGNVDFPAALNDPATEFDDPTQVLEERSLSRGQKIEILRRWEYDAREEAVATEENMPGGDDSAAILDRINNALHRLGAGPDTEHQPPTKQGGA